MADNKNFDHGELYEVDLIDAVLNAGSETERSNRPELDQRTEQWIEIQEPIVEQPRNDPGTRRPIPVWTTQWRSTDLSQLVPQSGLQFLAGTAQLEIQQTVELQDLLATVESENRYLVKVPGGETIFVAAETSSSSQRICLGSTRAFHMRLLDPSRQEAVHFYRRLACRAGILGCYLQRLEVVEPPGKFVGCVRQTWTPLAPALNVEDASGRVIYRVTGPGPCVSSEAVYKIWSSDSLTEVGAIIHKWVSSQATYVLSVVFPSPNLDNLDKALLLGAAFLLEYMYFETAKKKQDCFCCCC